MKKKGLHCCGFRYQHSTHTYNGKLSEGRGALSDLRAVKKQHFGIHHTPEEILSPKSSIA